MPSKFLSSLLTAVVLFLTKLKPLKPSTKMQVGHSSPSLAPWKSRSARGTEAVSAGPASPRATPHSSRSSRWRRIVQMAELGLPSETYGSSNRGKQPVRRFEESSPGTHVRNKCEAEQRLWSFCCSWHGSMLDTQGLFKQDQV